MAYDTQEKTYAPESRSSVPRRVATLLTIVVLAAAAAAGLSWLTRTTDETSTGITEDFSRVEVDVSAGPVEIIGSTNGEATLSARTQSGLFADADVSHEVDGDTLRVSGDCRGGWFSFVCRTDVTLTVPADVEVVAVSSAGRLDARGLQGLTDLRSSAGKVRVEDQSGDLVVHSSAGGVSVDGLTAESAKVTSSAGNVDIAVAEPPRSLDAESSAGGVDVTLPSGSSYDVEAETSAGNTDVDVDVNSSSGFKVRAFSSAGNVSVGQG